MYAVNAVDGPAALIAALADMRNSGDGWLSARSGVVALAFVLGTLGPGLGQCGQAQITHRFMALKDAALMSRARAFAIGWTVCMVLCTLVVGWCAKVLIAELGGFDVLTELAARRLPTVLAVTVPFALIVSMISSIDIMLLLITAAVASDARPASASTSLEFARVFLPFVAVAIVLFALNVPLSSAENATFAVNVLSAAFAPLMLVRLTGKRIRAGSMLGAMWAGLFLTAIFHAMPDAPGDFLECVLPFVASLGIALTGGERRHNPDRANRAATTVHDRMPI
jgi:sodium/proline symporter